MNDLLRSISNRMRDVLMALALFTGAMTSGCSMVTVRADSSMVRHHFGYTKVVLPKQASTSGDITVLEIDSYGVRYHRGVGVGYFHERLEYIPMDSRLVVRVANREQLERTVELLAPIVKDGLAVVVED